MNPFAGISTGYYQQGQLNQRRRSEMADAFVEFRQANPHATLAEMQQWIDARSGGRNYIAGGAPSGSVLQGIANENRRSKGIADRERRLSDLTRRQSLNDSLRRSASAYMRQFNGDVVKASEAMRTDLGGDMVGMDISGLFTPDAWAREVTTMTHQYLPAAQAFIKDNSSIDENGNVTTPSPEDVTKFLDIPLDVAKAITASTTKDLENQKADRDRAVQQRAVQQRRQILQDVIEQAEKGRDATEVFANYFKDEELAVLPENFITGIVEDAEQAKQRKDEERIAGFKTRAFETAITIRPTVQAQIINQDPDGARQIIEEAFNTLTPDAQEALGDQWVDEQYSVALSAAQGEQDRLRAVALTEARAQAAGAGNLVLRASRDAASNAQGLGVAQNALNAMSNKYSLDDSTVAIAVNAMQAVGKDASIDDQLAAADAALAQAGVPTISEATDIARDRLLKQGISEVDITPQEYETELSKELVDFSESWNTGINKVVEKHNDNPAALMSKLRTLATRIRTSRQTISEAVNYDMMVGQGGNPLSPITVGSGSINVDASLQFLEALQSVEGNLLQSIEEKIQDAAAREAAARDAVLNAPNPLATPRPGSSLGDVQPWMPGGKFRTPITPKAKSPSEMIEAIDELEEFLSS